jgi:hypothetical protein
MKTCSRVRRAHHDVAAPGPQRRRRQLQLASSTPCPCTNAMHSLCGHVLCERPGPQLLLDPSSVCSSSRFALHGSGSGDCCFYVMAAKSLPDAIVRQGSMNGRARTGRRRACQWPAPRCRQPAGIRQLSRMCPWPHIASTRIQSSSSVTTPHSGYHWDGSDRRFFEGWYWKVCIAHTHLMCRQRSWAWAHWLALGRCQGSEVTVGQQELAIIVWLACSLRRKTLWW